MARTRNILVGLVISGIVLIFLFLIAFSIWGLTSSNKDFAFIPHGERVAIVKVEGVIYGSEDIIRQLRKYGEDERVPAIVVRIDSPGGAAAPAEEIYNYINKVRDEGTYVVASLASVAASGGYYIASACDTIISNKGTLVGSIGVILSYLTFEGLMDKIGVQLEVIKAGELKDVGNYSRELTQKEREMLQATLNDAHDQFILAVANGRNMDVVQVEELADGSIFTGNQALSLGLVDRLGGLEDAISVAGEMAGLGEDPDIVREIPRKPTVMDYIAQTLFADLYGNVKKSVEPRLEYIYK